MTSVKYGQGCKFVKVALHRKQSRNQYTAFNNHDLFMAVNANLAHTQNDMADHFT